MNFHFLLGNTAYDSFTPQLSPSNNHLLQLYEVYVMTEDGHLKGVFAKSWTTPVIVETWESALVHQFWLSKVAQELLAFNNPSQTWNTCYQACGYSSIAVAGSSSEVFAEQHQRYTCTCAKVKDCGHSSISSSLANGKFGVMCACIPRRMFQSS